MSCTDYWTQRDIDDDFGGLVTAGGWAAGLGGAHLVAHRAATAICALYRWYRLGPGHTRFRERVRYLWCFFVPCLLTWVMYRWLRAFSGCSPHKYVHMPALENPIPIKKIILKNKNTPFVKKRYEKKQTRTNLAWLERTEF